MGEPNPIQNNRRRARQRAKLPPDAACVLCGQTTPAALLMVDRSILERHHVLGEATAPELTVPLCRNCHGLQTQAQLDLGVQLRRERRTVPETVVSVMRALGVFFVALGEWLLRLADQMAAFVHALDDHHAGWRGLPEAT